MPEKVTIRLKFIEQFPPAPRKTKVWSVSTATEILGSIFWYSHWRKYVFASAKYSVWDSFCLREIVDFMDNQNRLHRESLKTKKACGSYIGRKARMS